MSNYQLINSFSNVPDISIAMLAYNHQDYIAQAIESVLMQETKFSFKIVLAEDMSTDATRQIVLDYQKKYPDKIKLILQNENVGAQKNNVSLLENLHGKYIAALEGDDYWTDPYKLQKQVDFLEKNSKYNICGHSVACSKYDPFLQKKLLLKKDTIFSLKEVIQTNPIHTSSFCFRNNIDFSKNNFYNFILNAEIGDYPLLVLFAQSNGVFVFKDTMSVYRIDNQESEWTGKLNLEAQKKVMENTVNTMIASPLYNNVTKRYLKEKLKKKKSNLLQKVLVKIKKKLKSLF